MKDTLLTILLLFVSLSFGWSQSISFVRTDTVPVFFTGVVTNPWHGGHNSAQLSKIELNDDGLKDLFVFDRVGDKVHTYINIGSTGVPAYKYAPEYEQYFPDELRRWVLLRDYDGDGQNDIFGYTSGGMKVWRNTSSAGVVAFTQVEPLIYSQQASSYINLYVSSVDIPSIDDVDGDGDLDVLTFDQFGKYVEYHKNLSQENYGHSDSLKFELRNRCWGHFSESGGTNAVVLNDTCNNSDLGAVELTGSNTSRSSGAHAGSTVLSLDINGDGVKDLLLGDVMFNNVVMLENGGTVVNSNSSMIAQDTIFPDYDTPVDIQIFPACFYEDINNDGVRDLVVTSNSENLSEDNTSIHYYLNTNTDDNPAFSFQQNDFLQGDMIDLGTGAIPVFFDHNADGLLDLIVSNYGVLNKLTGDLEPTVWMFENQGSNTAPEFHLMTKKYMNLNTSGVGKNMVITFGDLDGDGDEDMLIGDETGMMHYFTNTAGPGATANFVLTQPNYQDDVGSVIDVGLRAAPWFYDLDGDLDLDLIIGEFNGNINYYENRGDTLSPSFSFVTDTLGKIQAKLNGGNIEMSVPRLFKDALGETQLFIGTESGEIRHFGNIDGNLTGTFVEVDTMVAGESHGPETVPCVFDINTDGYVDMLVGTRRGGVVFYNGRQAPNGVREEEALNLVVFPNPAGSYLRITGDFKGRAVYELYTISGSLAKKGYVDAGSEVIDVANLESGVYLLRLLVANVAVARKVVLK